MDNRTKYVLGFLHTRDKVVLIRKTRPTWQAGFLNGVGGKVEGLETAQQAMIREFHEETGVHHEQWEQFGEMQGVDYKVYCFSAFVEDYEFECMDLHTKTDEEVVIFDLKSITSPQVLGSARYWLMLAIESDNLNYVTISYS